MTNGSSGYLAISTETTFGVAITTPQKFYPVEENDASFENEFIEWMENRGSRQGTQTADGPVRPQVTFKGAVYPSGAMGLFLKGLTGAVTSALETPSTTAYRHQFKDAETIPSFTIERSTGRGASALLCERIAGCKVESLKLSATFGEKVNMDVTFQAARRPVTATAVVAGSVIYPSTRALTFTHAAVEIDDVANANFKDLSLEFTNKLTREEVLNGTDEADSISEGAMEVTLSGTAQFKDLTLYNKMAKGTAGMKVEVIFTSDQAADAVPTPDVMYQLKFTYDEVRLASIGLPYKSGETTNANVTFKVKSNATTGRMVLPELVNLDNATTYN